MSSIVVTLVTRHGCCLCEEMEAIVVRVGAELGIEWRRRDVDADEALRSRYDQEVPVLLVNGRKAFKYRVSEAALRDRLEREGRRTMRVAP